MYSGREIGFAGITAGWLGPGVAITCQYGAILTHRESARAVHM